MRHLLQYTLKWMFGELVCNGPFNTANHSWYDCWTLIRSDSPFSVVSIHEGKKNIVNHVRQSGYFMTSWHGIYGMDPAIRAHQKVNVDSLFSLFVLINTFVCWPYYGCCYDVFLWDKEVIYQKQQAPFTLQYLTTGWTLQLVEHTHPFFFRKIRAAPSGLGNPWSMPNSSSSINHQLQQRFGGNPRATPAASDQVVDSHKGEFHHGADWRIDLAPEGREWGPCHPPLFSMRETMERTISQINGWTPPGNGDHPEENPVPTPVSPSFQIFAGRIPGVPTCSNLPSKKCSLHG